MEKYIREFHYYLISELHLSDNTWHSYESDVSQYINYIVKYRNVNEPNDITLSDLRSYIDALNRKKIVPSSQSRKLSAIKSFHKFMVKEKIVSEDITSAIDLPKQVKKLPTVLSVEEVDMLLNSLTNNTPIESRNKAMIELAYASGLRVSELVGLTLPDLHLDAGFVQVHGKGNKERIKNNERTLITTLTIKMSEDLTAYLKEVGIKVAYLHSEIKALERLEIIRALRKGTYDVLVGINLLREGLDIPEVSLICILDADKEGFLRSERSLIQTIGRAARNANGKVVLYADTMTDSMTKAINETNRRRKIQNEYNIEHHIIPQTIIKEIGESVSIVNPDTGEVVEDVIDKETYKSMSKVEKKQLIEKLELAMKKASKELNFEEAIMLRDTILELKAEN